MSLSINGAAQIMRLPSDGLPMLRHDRASEIEFEPGGLSVAGARIAALTADPSAQRQIDAQGCAIVPGLVDCHTHLPFAGWRAGEYAMRVAGRTYEEIAQAGGGIRASARALGESPDTAVLTQARDLAGEMLQHGTTTLETKSGYGLTIEAEIRTLRLADDLRRCIDQEVRSTALVAHTVPDGHSADGWLDEVEAHLTDLTAAADVQALDIFVESMAFTNAHLGRVGKMAASHGLDLRAHVEQLGQHRSVGPAVAAGARSVDHLACLHLDDVAVLAEAECAAVLLPGAEFLGKERTAPARELADAGAVCVLATDANPGTSPVVSMPVIIGLAVRRYGWTVAEALLASTLNAAWVLRCSEELGSLEVGKRADLLVLDGPVEMVPYRFGHNPVALVVLGGEIAFVREDQAWRLT